VAVLLITLVGVIFLANLKPAWADMIITPNPPIAGQPFTIGGVSYLVGMVLDVYSGSGCHHGSVVFSQAMPPNGGSYDVTVPGLPAGTYSAGISGTTYCMNFDISNTSSYKP
jgi:hypothetical protein